METETLRISKLRDYLFTIITSIIKDDKYQINVNMLSDKKDNYSLDKIPVQSTLERWITGFEIHRDVYAFRSRMAYSQDVIVNLKNVGFFEIFESIISGKNEKGELPDIEGIQSIKCLNAGTMVDSNTNTCEFQIQLQIEYQYGGIL